MKLSRLTVAILGLSCLLVPGIGHAQQADAVPYLSSEDIAALQSMLRDDAPFAMISKTVSTQATSTQTTNTQGRPEQAARVPAGSSGGTPVGIPSGQAPINIVVHNFIVVPDSPTQMPAYESVPAPAQAVPAPIPVIPTGVAGTRPAPRPQVEQWLPVSQVEVIPGLPDPSGTEVYRLQVGAFSGGENVTNAIKRVQAAGFTATQESAGNVIRVLVPGVPARNVFAAVQHLASVGFGQVWVRN